MENTATILIVDDEQAILRMLRVALTAQKFKVIEATNVQSAIPQFALARPDVAIVDLGLPDGSGTDIIRDVRKWSEIPIIILTATDNTGVKIEVLDAGADDYLVKPFDVGELLARVRVMLRRSKVGVVEHVVKTGKLEIDLSAHVVRVNGDEVHLTQTEFDILSLLARHLGKVLTHTMLIKALRGPTANDDISYLRVFIGQLRKKIEQNPSLPKYIKTETGVGYRLVMLDEQ